MPNYRVTAPLVLLKIKDQTGKALINSFYAGAIVAGSVADEASLRRHLDRGWIEEIDEPATEPATEPVSNEISGDGPAEGEGGDQSPTKPSQNDPKSTWVDYAVTRGIDRAEADGITKVELIDLLK